MERRDIQFDCSRRYLLAVLRRPSFPKAVATAYEYRGGGIEPGKTWEWKQKWGTGRYFVLLRLGEREGFVPFIVDEDILSVRIEIPSLTVAYETGKRT